ncbi:hypothetical protein PT974_08730 [Cladobotryum mycophilum]|uniref:Zinc finger C2H2 LYAR-type domain-containing protein n=1 Tax=Cladobotryum mycophilum TaxID=491253 RepID=A0ABR0SE56_9HYPO
MLPQPSFGLWRTVAGRGAPPRTSWRRRRHSKRSKFASHKLPVQAELGFAGLRRAWEQPGGSLQSSDAQRACGDVLTKKKLDPHRNRCRGATFTCIDCMVHFPGFEYRSHTSCMTEDQKYQGALYKAKKPYQRPTKTTDDMNTLALQPYVEDIGEDQEYESWHEYEARTDDERSPVEPPPEAPTPPSANPEDDNVNVFDFLMSAGQTPNASTLSLPREPKVPDVADSTSLVRYEPKADELMEQDVEPPVRNEFVTPAPKTERRKSKDGEVKKDKKRKRLHVDVAGDQIMADAPPVLHSGLTGGLKSLSSKPAQEDEALEAFQEHSNHYQPLWHDRGTPKSKSKKQKSSSSKKHSHHHKEKKPKLIDYRPSSKDGKDDDANGQMIVFKPRADVFLSFVNKGPESEKGCSMNKALKRFHRERQAAGSSNAKGKEEKELWRSLRLRRNDRGEIVLFSA